MKSMTGFGFVSKEGKDYTIEVSVKAINSRFMDVKFYTPPFYFSLEQELRKMVFKLCSRGQWVVHIDRFPQKPHSLFNISWDKKQALKWKKVYKNLSREMGVKDDLGVSHLARLDGVVTSIEKTHMVNSVEKRKVRLLVRKAFNLCLQERLREGNNLKKDIFKNLKVIQDILKIMKKLNHQKMKQVRKQYQNGRNVESSGKERFDVSEEIVRIDTHLKNFTRIAKSSQPMGKKLEFYAQELFRELNTIGSKSQMGYLTLKVVDSKFALEKIKEQVQNLE